MNRRLALSHGPPVQVSRILLGARLVTISAYASTVAPSPGSPDLAASNVREESLTSIVTALEVATVSATSHEGGARDRTRTAHVRDARHSRQRGAVGDERADRDAVDPLRRRLPARGRRPGRWQAHRRAVRARGQEGPGGAGTG